MRKAVGTVRAIRKIRGFCLPLVGAAAFALVAVPASAQEQSKPALMVLGAAHFEHFDTPGRDLVNFDIEDVLSPRRQQEIEAVIVQLVEFHPTRIAIEMSEKNQAVLDQRYQDYREGRYELGRNEAAQLGLRLAARLGHERVYAVDWNDNPPGDEADYDWPAFAEAHGQEAAAAG